MISGTVNSSRFDAYCRDNGFIQWFQTSAKDGTNVEESIMCLVKKIRDTEKEASHGPYPQPGSTTSNEDNLQVDPTAATAQPQDSGDGCSC